jgi:hypothetical protein
MVKNSVKITNIRKEHNTGESLVASDGTANLASWEIRHGGGLRL